MPDTTSESIAFEDGEILFAAGEAGGRGYLVLHGRVVLRDRDGHPVFVGHPGDVIGELAALFGRPQDLTAMAEGPVRVAAVTRREIDRAIEADPDSARLLGRQMLNALRLAPRISADTPVNAVAPDAWTSIRILPDGEAMAAQIADEGVEVPFLPFNIGRAAGHGERPSRTTIHLMLYDEVPYNISRHHMSIEASQNAIMVRDVGSHLGTVVNGVKIGIEQPSNVANLHPGDNIVWAGGVNTPFRFVIAVGT